MTNTAVAPAGDGSRTLGSRVYDRLRDDIVRGELAPGQKLTLDALKERYGVGITPLREALYRLSASLLVLAEDQRGFRVAPASPEHRADIVAVRQHIETLVLRDAFEHGDLAWESRILSALHQLKRTPMYEADGSSITREWEVAHRNFHQAALAAAQSSTLRHLQAMLWDHAARYRNLVKACVLEEAALDGEHEELANAILDRDEQLACLLLSRHILGAAKPVQEAIRSYVQPERGKMPSVI